MRIFRKISFLIVLIISTVSNVLAQEKLKVVVAGLSHDHAHIIMNAYRNNEIELLGIAEANEKLVERYRKSYGFPKEIVHNSLESVLINTKPDVVLAYNPVSEHIDVAQICMPLSIPVMVEKPLATTQKTGK